MARLRDHFFILLLACSVFPAFAAEAPLPTLMIPLEPYLRAQAVVDAVVNGHPGTFVFDTGEGVTSFLPSSLKRSVDIRGAGSPVSG
jgi:hypothetical protein